MRADVDQIHSGASSRGEGWTEADLRRHQPGPDRRHVDAAVEAFAVRRRVSSHDRAGTTQVRAHRLEHSVRVQPGGLHHNCPVHPEPPGRPRSKEGLQTNAVVVRRLLSSRLICVSDSN